MNGRAIRYSPVFRTAAVGGMLSVVAGLAAGWIRYWIGYFVLFQGAVAGVAIALAASALVRTRRGGVIGPDAPIRLGVAAIWFVLFQAGQTIGFGLAQPWFDPVVWFFKVLNGRAAELVFGAKSSGGNVEDFAMGATGFLWIAFTLVDWAVMFFFLYRLPWNASDPKADEADGDGDGEQMATPPPAWHKAVNIAVGAVLLVGVASAIFTFRPDVEIKASRVALRAGDSDAAMRLARRAAFASRDPGMAAEALATQIRVAGAEGRESRCDALFQKLMADYPESPWTLVLWGERAFKSGDRSGGAVELARGVDALGTKGELSPKDLLPYLLLRAEAYADLSQFPEADRDIQTVLKTSPRNPEVLWTASVILEKQGKFPEAQKAAGEAIRAAEWRDAGFYFSDTGRRWADRFVELGQRAEKAAGQ